MKKAASALFALTLPLAAALAQSGRRAVNPPPEPPPPAAVREEAPPGDGWSSERTPAPVVLKYVPEFVLGRELSGLPEGSFRLADFGGKVIVLNLWASWCGPCRREIPELKEAHRDYAGRGVEFVGLTIEDPADGERVTKFLSELKVPYRLGWADRLTARTLAQGYGAIPQTFVISADGEILKHLKGYSPTRTAPMLRAAIDEALADKK